MGAHGFVLVLGLVFGIASWAHIPRCWAAPCWCQFWNLWEKTQTLAYIPVHGHEYGRKIARRSFLASPRYDIAAEIYRAGEQGIGKIAVGDGQLCVQPGMYYVRGVFFHVLTRGDVARGPPTWCRWDDWLPAHEIPLE